MYITEFLNGHTVEDIRRNRDDSVTLFCDSGRTITLHVVNGKIEARPPEIRLPDQSEEQLEIAFSERMRLREAFQGYMINYAIYDQKGGLVFVCEPHKHNREKYKKSHGHREITMSHSNGIIDELPPVSAVIALPSLSVFGKGP